MENSVKRRDTLGLLSYRNLWIGHWATESGRRTEQT